jgi:heparanase
MPYIGTVDERYQSYNVEMLEITGGKFWKPYGAELDAVLRQSTPSAKRSDAPSGSDTPSGMDPALYQYRAPIDLTNTRLRKLAAALGPAYVRVSGTWANTTYFSETDQAPTTPPSGFKGVLSHAQWKGVIDFAKAVDAQIVTSFAVSVGTRDSTRAWTATQAERFLDYTRSVDGRIAAAEFMNEPTFAAMGGAPDGYDAADFGRDFKIFHAFARQAAPDMLILGPGSVGETAGEWGVAYGSAPMLKTRDLLAASHPAHVDAFSYHHYGASSQRCAAMGMQTTAEAALSEQWLRRTDETLAFYGKLRDEYEPGKPLWLTETADAACGGNPWGRAFLDSFRYLDQLGRLAKQGVRVVAHNTLVASDYGLLDDTTLEPKPNYWAALLWHRIMGSTVLESGVPIQDGLHLYAHCLQSTPGGVALLAINNSRTPRFIDLPTPAERYTLTAQTLENPHAHLNGKELKMDDKDRFPDLQATIIRSGTVELAPTSISFLAIPAAGNTNCQ